MKPGEQQLARELRVALDEYERQVMPLPGINTDARCTDAFIERIIESDRRVRYFARLSSSEPTRRSADPNDDRFDPLGAAVFYRNTGSLDDAAWMVFWFVQFGRNLKTGYQLARDVYGRLGGRPWSWSEASANPRALERWVHRNAEAIRARGGRFGNHRKYESLNWTGMTARTYVNWVGGSHDERFDEAESRTGSMQEAFDHLYRSMGTIHRFGRVARFDYLATLARLDLADIRPGRPYFSDATGPLEGARELFADPGAAPRALEARVIRLDTEFLHRGLDVMEDAICNWQKSPAVFTPFRG